MHHGMRAITKSMACVAILTAGITVAAPAASAATGKVIASSGLYIQDGPSLNARTIGILGYQSTADFDCYLNGDAVTGPYGTETIWDHLLSGGYVSDAWVFTNNNGAVVPLCSAVATPAPTPTSDGHHYINLFDVGFPQNEPHEWGSGCTVQDFNGGPFGWVIVGYSSGTHIVRNGMLSGWFDYGGGPGDLGCPTTDEYSFGNGVRQDFVGGSLSWAPGMDRSVRMPTPPPCVEAYGFGGRGTAYNVWGGSGFVYDRLSSLSIVCEGFGLPENVPVSGAMKCAIITSVAVLAGPPVGSAFSSACLTASILKDAQSGNLLAAAVDYACSFFSDALAVGAGTFVAGALAETGPWAIAIGVATYRAVAAGMQLACGGIFSGGGNSFGQWVETRHETHVAADIVRSGKCLGQEIAFGWESWSAVDCL